MVTSTPAIDLSSSPASCALVPGGGVPMLSLPGSRLAAAITSASEFSGADGCAISTIGVEEISPIGLRSFSV